jgi:uncharacterized membrane protein
MDDNVASALCYVPLIGGILFLVMAPYNQKKSIRFHAFQSLFVFGIVMVVSWIIPIFYDVSWSLGRLISRVVSLAGWALWIYLGVMAYQGKKISLPVIGPLAEKQA